MSESCKAWPDVVLLAHFEILAEVLVTAPPVQVDHAQAFVPSNLMEVRVADVVLFTIGRETAIPYSHRVPLVGLTQMPAPVLNHPLFLVFNHGVEEEALIQMEAKQHPHESDAISVMQWLHLPVSVREGIFKESRNILESPPFLCVVTWFLRLVDEFGVVTISRFGQCSKQHHSVTHYQTFELTFQSCLHAH